MMTEWLGKRGHTNSASFSKLAVSLSVSNKILSALISFCYSNKQPQNSVCHNNDVYVVLGFCPRLWTGFGSLRHSGL